MIDYVRETSLGELPVRTGSLSSNLKEGAEQEEYRLEHEGFKNKMKIG